MAVGEARIEFVGSLTADPEMKFLQSGAAVTNFTVAVNGRRKNQQTDQWEDLDGTFYRCAVWRDMAENVAASLSKGDRVIVLGTVKQREYDKEDGTKGYSLEVDVDAVGPDLRFAQATVNRANRGGGQQGGQQQQGGGAWGPPQQPAQGNPWGQQQQAAPQWAGEPQQGAQPPQQGAPQGQQGPPPQQAAPQGPPQGQQGPPPQQDPWMQGPPF